MSQPTAAKLEGGPGSFFIFDAYNFIFRAYHALPMLNAPDGTPVNAVHGYVRMVQAVRREFAPARVLAVFDGGGDGKRKQVFPGYKAQRPPPPEDLKPQFSLVRQATDALGIPRVEDPDYEADDLIASYVEKARAAGERVVIVSSDKDLMQLCTLGDGAPPVLLFDTMKNKALGPREVEEKFGVPPELLGDLLALTGDSSDNIPGVPGIGVKTAAALLHEYGSLEGVLAGASGIKQQKRRERLVEHAEAARKSRVLVELHREVALPLPLDALEDHGSDEDALLAFFEPLGFKQVLREIAVTSGSKAAARKVEEDPGAAELVRVPGFAPERGSYRTLLGGDGAALRQLVRDLQAAPEVTLFVATEGEDPLRAEVVGIGLAAEGVAPTYVPVAHRQGDLVSGPQLAAGEVVDALRPVLEDDARPKACHDGKTAAHALRNGGIELRGDVLDPMLLSYTVDPARPAHTLESLAEDVLGHALPLPETLLGKGRKAVPLCETDPSACGAYVAERVEATHALARALRAQLTSTPPATQKLLREVEMPLSTVLGRLERRGILLDTDVLGELGRELAASVAAIQAKVEQDVGHPVNLDSPLQLQKLLFEERQLPPTRKTKTGYSTDARALEELSLLDPIVRDILEYRSVVKLKNTYVDALPRLVDPQSGRLHTSFNQAVASTGRLSSSDPNLQNIPIRTREGRRIREAFVAPPGRMLVAMDYSQIELRVLAHLSGDPSLKSAFLEGVDVHRRTAAEVFGVPEDEVDAEKRRIAKAVNFGVVYGQTAFGLAQQLGIPRGKAGSYIRAYFEKIPGVDSYMRAIIEIARQRGYAETILGRRRRIPELRRKGAARSHGERIARNTPIQGSAADILKVAMIRVDEALQGIDYAQMLLTVHDELIFECDEGRVDDLVALARPLMQGAAELSVPLQVDAGWGATWGACKTG